MVLALAVAVAPAAALAQTSGLKSDNYVQLMPGPDEVVSKIIGSDKADTEARQVAVLDNLIKLHQELAGSRYFRNAMTPSEKALNESYYNAYSRIRDPYMTGNERQYSFIRAAGNYEFDEAFTAEWRAALLPAKLLKMIAPVETAIKKFHEAERAKAQAENNAQKQVEAAAARSDAAATRSYYDRLMTEVGRGGEGMSIVYGYLGIGTGFVLLSALFGLPSWLGAFMPPQIGRGGDKPVIRVASKTYFINSTVGALLAQVGNSTNTHHVAGTETRDGHGNLLSSTPGYSYTITDQGFVLETANGSHKSFDFRNWGIVAIPGHVMGVLAAIKQGQTSGPYVAIYNYGTEKLIPRDASFRAMANTRGIAQFLNFLGLIGATMLGLAFVPGASAIPGLLMTMGVIFVVWLIVSAGRAQRTAMAIRSKLIPKILAELHAQYVVGRAVASGATSITIE